MKRTPIIAALAGMLAATPASTQGTGNDLHGLCGDLGRRDFCLGYAAGLRDGLLIGALGGSECWPDGLPGTNATQVHDVIINYLRDHPDIRHEPLLQLVWYALHEAWPCERK